MAAPIGGGANRSITKQEWENMKSFIRRVYIDENKTFPYLASVLRTEFGLEPTKKQFSRKIEEWGLRKNVSQPERQRILKSFETGQLDQAINLDDPRISSRKLENWKKKYKKDATTMGSLPSINAAAPGLDTFDPDAQISGLATPWDVQVGSQVPYVIESINSFPNLEDMGTHTMNTEPEDSNSWLQVSLAIDQFINYLTAEAWPFDWSKVDIHGSPNLSGLFEALEIDCSTSIPTISLDTSTSNESEYITQHGLTQLWKEENKSRTYTFEISNYSRNSELIQGATESETGFLPWSNPQLVLCGWNSSPFNEVYLFPKRSMKTLHRVPNLNFAWLQVQATECESRLEKLKPLCGFQHPSIRATMNALAKIYHSQGRYREAERCYRAVFDAERDALGAENYATLDAGLSWIDALVAQGRYLYAQANIFGLRSTILAILGNKSILNARANFIEARIAGTLGNYTKAEVLIREALQQRLNDFGPRDSDTWRCMDYLAWILERQSRFSGAEKLSRIALQLHHEISGLDERELCSAKRYLSLICSYQGRYDESRDLSRLLQEQLETSLGPEHPWVSEAQYAIAVSLKREGKFLESEKLYRKVWSQRLKVLGESHPDTWNTASSLAYLLYRMNCFEEAIIWYERFFWERLEIYGPDSEKTMNACCWLGDCYQKLGRHDNALQLYQQIADKIRAAKGEESPGLEQVQSLINWTVSKALEEENEEIEESSVVKERRRTRESKG